MSALAKVRYHELRAAAAALASLRMEAHSVFVRYGPASEQEAVALDRVVDAALLVAARAAELSCRGAKDLDAPTRMRARLSVAAEAAEIARDEICSPMDPPLARLMVASELLHEALEDF